MIVPLVGLYGTALSSSGFQQRCLLTFPLLDRLPNRSAVQQSNYVRWLLPSSERAGAMTTLATAFDYR